MVTARIAKILAGEYNENFNSLQNEILKLALAKEKDINLNLSYYKWLKEIEFDKFKEVMTALGYEVFNNKTSFKVRW